MKHIFITLIANAISLLCLPAFAEIPEFLIPVTASDEAVVLAKNDYFVKRNTYFARRYRLVEVNTELLMATNRFRISLFDDDFISVDAVEHKTMHGGLSIRWKGRIVTPILLVEELMVNGVTREEADYVHSVLTELKIVAAEISYDETSGSKYQFNFPKFERYRKPRLDGAAGENSLRTEKAALYDVGFTIEAPLTYQYWLRPLETDPRYHLLIEVDPEKSFTWGSMDDTKNPDQAAKRREYSDFLRSLGPDPRASDLHSE